MQYYGSGDIGLFHDLLTTHKEISFGNPFTGFLTLIQAGWDYLVLVWRLFWWDYAFFYGTYEIIRILCWTISVGIVVSLILAVTRGTSSA